MNCLEWIDLYEAFEVFEARAKSSNFHVREIEAMGKELFDACPIPQPKPTKDSYEECESTAQAVGE